MLRNGETLYTLKDAENLQRKLVLKQKEIDVLRYGRMVTVVRFGTFGCAEAKMFELEGARMRNN